MLFCCGEVSAVRGSEPGCLASSVMSVSCTVVQASLQSLAHSVNPRESGASLRCLLTNRSYCVVLRGPAATKVTSKVKKLGYIIVRSKA